ncbi:MAG: prolyl oligopeptidase family serine peptidase [Myxococcales bacterium]|nr:prolyl oligopeptidase family serine peptidase [Myxococcales bacterium]
MQTQRTVVHPLLSSSLRVMRRLLALPALALSLLACGEPLPGPSAASSTEAMPVELERVPQVRVSSELPSDGTAQAWFVSTESGPIMSRPYKYKVPSRYDASKPTPLVVMLHGFTASGELNELILRLAPLSESRTFLYAFPDGTKNPLGMRFWNATDFCCNFFGSTVDDVAYVTAVIDDMASRYNVDKRRVFLVGHSNGGYMAHRMACDRSSKIAGIVSLAGAQWKDATRCRPTDKVAVLQVHGTVDTLVAFGGGPLYPSAKDTVATWANRNGCLGRLTYGGKRVDLDSVIPGAETKIEEYTGCSGSGAVELWTIEGGSHVPAFTSYWPGAIYDFLMAHPKP